MTQVSKTWCFTLNNYSKEEEDSLPLRAEINYLIYGREVSTTGTRHLQGFLTLKKAARLTGVRKLLPRAHWEVSRSVEASIKYCQKDGDYVEVDNRSPARARTTTSSSSSLSDSRIVFTVPDLELYRDD